MYTKTLTLENSKIQDVCIVILSSLLIGLFGQFSFPLPFSPVPLSTQDTLILALAILLGPKRATAAVLLFLAQGAIGLPVFANNGTPCGLTRFVGPTGGYLLSYPIAAYLTGALSQQLPKTLLNTLLAFLAGSATMFFFGVGYLSTFVGFTKAIWLGFMPFIPGNILKTFIAMKLIGQTRSQ
ncbi:MAG TPA: biotin transporter BioY [Chlamydiales bacterium]|nr:biotin transporter BioY [Chlamydiales bacterium]